MCSDEDDKNWYYIRSTGKPAAEGRDIYFCCDEDDGHAKKNRWVKEYNSVDYGADDSDNEKFWFYFDKNGKAFVPAADESTSAQTWILEDIYAEDGQRFEADDTHTAATKKIDGKTYAFNQDGEMLYGFVEMDGKMYYFGGAKFAYNTDTKGVSYKSVASMTE